MNWQVIKIKTLLWLRRIILYGLYSLVISIVLGFAVLQIPAVQESIISRLTRNFSSVTGFKVTFDYFYLVWYDRLQIEGLNVQDPEKNNMLGVEKLYVNYSFTSLLKGNDINIDAVELDGAQINLITIAESDTSRDLNINLFIARINERYSSGKGGGGKTPKINIGEIIVDNSLFTYSDPKQDSIKSGFDFSHFSIDLKDIQAQNFKVIGDTIEFNLQSFHGLEQKTQFEIQQFQTYFRLSQTSMEFLGIHAKAGKSIIGGHGHLSLPEAN